MTAMTVHPAAFVLNGVDSADVDEADQVAVVGADELHPRWPATSHAAATIASDKSVGLRLISIHVAACTKLATIWFWVIAVSA